MIERTESEQLQRAQRGDLQAMLAEAYQRGYDAAMAITGGQDVEAHYDDKEWSQGCGYD